MKSQRFIRAAERVKPEHRAFVVKNLDIIEQIQRLLLQKGWTQKTFAQRLGKSESEISKWMSGLHNFTLQSIIKIEEVLEGQVLVTPLKHQEILVAKVKQQLAIDFEDIFREVTIKFRLNKFKTVASRINQNKMIFTEAKKVDVSLASSNIPEVPSTNLPIAA